MDKPFSAYRGSEPYVFVCYAHEDAETVYTELRWLHEQGVNLWYDEGISTGHEWTEKLASAIGECERFLFFVSPRSVESRHCRNEVQYALELDKKFVAVYVEATTLPPGLKLSIGLTQALLKQELKPDDYQTKLLDAIKGRYEKPTPDSLRGSPRIRLRPAHKLVLSLFAAAVIGSGSLFFFTNKTKQTYEQPVQIISQRSIAVMPFKSIGQTADDPYFAEGLAEELLNTFTRIPGLQVASRTASFDLDREDLDARDIGQQLRVAKILEGAVRRSGDQLHVSVEIIDAQTGYQIWANRYDAQFDDVFVIQNEITTAVVDALEMELQDTSHSYVQEIDPDAFSLYLQGKYQYRQSTALGLQRAIGLLEKSLQLEPGYADALDNLALVHIRQADLGLAPAEQAYEQARRALLTARQHDPDNAEVLAHLAWIAMVHDWDFREASNHLILAASISPKNPTVLGHAAKLAMIFGRLDETIPYREEIVARNPLSRTSHHNLGNAYYFASLYSQAEAMFVRALDLRPNYLGGYFHLGLVYLARGDLDKARTSLQREPDAGWRLQGKSLVAYASGDQATSDAALLNLQDAHSAEMAYQIAQTHAFRNEPDRAFSWLERAYAQHDSGLPELYVDPLLSNLHSDPRWNVMLTQLGIIQ